MPLELKSPARIKSRVFDQRDASLVVSLLACRPRQTEPTTARPAPAKLENVAMRILSTCQLNEIVLYSFQLGPNRVDWLQLRLERRG